MFARGKTTASLARPKKLHSLEYLKYLCSVLQKNATVTEQNSATIVEAVRLIAEILIWGDQNDSTVMDFFLEKNMLGHFVKYLKQTPGRTVCVQLLQTLNILFENISNKNAVYYLLSNNHTNEIITHRFDFADEEVVAYYISFLKTLSLRLNAQTINFFFFEALREFDLYVECIKLFCHPENMVRIAVRTITLNVHRVKDEGALEFIHHQTALPYFSFLVWSIGNTILDIDALILSDLNPQNLLRLDDLVAEHVDHLHYLNDLLSLDIEGINEILCDLFLHRLLIPLHIYSLTEHCDAARRKQMGAYRPHVAHPVAVSMLTHVFIIIQHTDIVRVLTEALFLGSPSLTEFPRTQKNMASADRLDKGDQGVTVKISSTDMSEEDDDVLSACEETNPALTVAHSLVDSTIAIRKARIAPSGERLAAYMENTRKPERHPAFLQPKDSLAVSLQKAKGVTRALLRSIWPPDLSPLRLTCSKKDETESVPVAKKDTFRLSTSLSDLTAVCDSVPRSSNIENAIPCSSDQSRSVSPSPAKSEQSSTPNPISSVRSTPMLHLNIRSSERTNVSTHYAEQGISDDSLQSQGLPFLRALSHALEVGSGTDYEALFTLLLFSVIRDNRGIDPPTLLLAGLAEPDSSRSPVYNQLLVGKLLALIADACKAGSRVRLITLHLAMRLLTGLVCDSRHRCYLTDEHFAVLINAREEAMMVLRSYFRNDAIFLDLFEHELHEVQQPFVALNKLAMDSSLLIPPLVANVLGGTLEKSPNSRRDYRRRLPHSEMEHTQRAVHVFLLVHIGLESLLRAKPADPADSSTSSEQKVLTTTVEPPMFSPHLPVDLALVQGLAGLGAIPDVKATASLHKAGDKLDLSSEALIGCTVECDGSHSKRFLVNFSQQLVLVEPDSRQMGWGVITFIGPLQDLEATCDPADSRCLHVTVNASGHLTVGGTSSTRNTAFQSVTSQRNVKHLLAARFLFEDHIRCMTARQMLLRGRELARQRKLRKIAVLLDFSPQFLRETFVFGMCGSTGNFTRFSEQNVSADCPHGFTLDSNEGGERQTVDLNMSRTSVGPNPSTFLMERQFHRPKHNRLEDEDEGPMPRVSLAPFTKSSPHHGSHLSTRKPPACNAFHLGEPANLTPVTLVQQQLPVYKKSHAFTVTVAPDDVDSCRRSTSTTKRTTVAQPPTIMTTRTDKTFK